MNISDAEKLLADKMLSEHSLVNYPEKETVLSVLKEVHNLYQSELADLKERVSAFDNAKKEYESILAVQPYFSVSA